MASPLFNFAYFPDFDGNVKHLADSLAQRENWDYRRTEATKNYPILSSFLQYTFARLEEQNKIAYAKNEQLACYNTGLVTDNYEEIFAFFEINKNPNKQKYIFKGFLKESDNRLFEFGLPELASYMDNPSDFIFDIKKELRFKVGHIIDENRERFPIPFDSMKDNHQLRIALDGAIKHALRRVQRNYRTAVPQFYKGSVQLLLPLCMSNASEADLALAIKNEGSIYSAYTCLTLDMAYNNARLLAKPDSDWLDPSKITQVTQD